MGVVPGAASTQVYYWAVSENLVVDVWGKGCLKVNNNDQFEIEKLIRDQYSVLKIHTNVYKIMKSIKNITPLFLFLEFLHN